MLVVRVELHPHGDETRMKELARMIIANDGTGTFERGNYWGLAAKGIVKGERMISPAIMHPSRKMRRAEVKNYPRASKHVWNLVARMLTNMGTNDHLYIHS